MAYTLDLHPEKVTQYLRHYPGLSREGRLHLFTQLISDLRQYADHYRADPTRRVVPGSEYFWYRVVLRDGYGDNRLRRFRFAVSDAKAQYGVLRVLYVDCWEGPEPP